MAEDKDPELEQIRQKYIQDLRTGQYYSIGKFDDQVLLISTGTLALSLNFIHEVVKLNEALYLWMLYSSWWCFVSTIVVSVGAHLVSYHISERQIKRVEANQALPDDKITIRLNYFMAVSLIFGIVLQIIFITVNTDYMAKQNLGIKGNTPTPTSKIQDRALPQATAPKEIRPGKTGEGLALPIQAAPKAIKTPTDTTNSTTTKK